MDFKIDILGNKIEQGSVVIAVDNDIIHIIGVCIGFTNQKIRILQNSLNPYIHLAWDGQVLKVMNYNNYHNKGEIEKLLSLAPEYIAKDKPRQGVKKKKSDIKI